MKSKLMLLAGAAVGYVLGTRAGRERYEQIKESASRFWKSPGVQNKVSDAEHFVADTAKSGFSAASSKIRSRVSGGSDDSDWSEDAGPDGNGAWR